MEVNNKQQFVNWFVGIYPTQDQLDSGWMCAIDVTDGGVTPSKTPEEQELELNSSGEVIALYCSPTPVPDLRFEEYSIDLEEIEALYNAYLNTL